MNKAEKFKTGDLVISTAGRDSGRLMLVVRAEENAVFVCDGGERPLERPKRKNPSHLRLAGDGQDIMKATVGNKSLKRALKAYESGTERSANL